MGQYSQRMTFNPGRYQRRLHGYVTLVRRDSVPRAVVVLDDRNQVQKLLEGGAQLIAVLPAEVYEDEHLPGASNIPLAQLDE
jgi:hypothetical protein